MRLRKLADTMHKYEILIMAGLIPWLWKSYIEQIDEWIHRMHDKK